MTTRRADLDKIEKKLATDETAILSASEVRLLTQELERRAGACLGHDVRLAGSRYLL